MSKVRTLHGPPNNLDAEAAVLSAIILDANQLPAVRALLEPEHFYADANRRVYEAVLAIADRDAKVDAVSVATELRNGGRLEQIGGTPYIAQLIDATPAVAHAADHAELVRTAAIARTGMHLCASAAAALRTGSPLEHLLELAEKLRELARPIDAQTSWVELDVANIFAPLAPINYLLAPLDICAGAPALFAGFGFSGKTVAAQALAISLASGQTVWGAFKPSVARVLVRVLHIDYEQGPRLTMERYQRLSAGMLIGPSELEDRLVLVSMPQVYLDGAGAERFLFERCANVDLVIIDSLRAACPTLDENDSAVRGVLDMLTRVSTRTGCAFLVLHHARKPQQNTSGGAKMSIRGSGAIFDACGSVLVFEGEKGQPTRVTHEKARTSGRPADDFLLRIEDVETDGDPRGALAVTAESSAPAPSAEARAAQALDALQQRIVDHLREHGSAPGKNALYARLGGDRTRFYAAVRELEAAGLLVNVGTHNQPKLVLKETQNHG